MEELINKIQRIFDNFLQEEFGNRLSQFAMKGLRDVIFDEIKNYKPIKSEAKEGVKKDAKV